MDEVEVIAELVEVMDEYINEEEELTETELRGILDTIAGLLEL